MPSTCRPNWMKNKAKVKRRLEKDLLRCGLLLWSCTAIKLVGVVGREGRKPGWSDGHGYINEWDERVIRAEHCAATVHVCCSCLRGGSWCVISNAALKRGSMSFYVRPCYCSWQIGFGGGGVLMQLGLKQNWKFTKLFQDEGLRASPFI